MAAVFLEESRRHPWILTQIIILSIAAIRIRADSPKLYSSLAASYALGAAWYARTPIQSMKISEEIMAILDFLQVAICYTLSVFLVKSYRSWRYIDLSIKLSIVAVISAAVFPLLFAALDGLGILSEEFYRPVSFVAYSTLPTVAIAIAITQEIKEWHSRQFKVHLLN